MKQKVLLTLLSLLMIATSSCVERINAGHEGIRTSLIGSDRGIDEKNLVVGWVWYNPFSERVDEYPTFVQTIDYPEFTTNAKDGAEFVVDPTILVRVQVGKTPYIFGKYRLSVEKILNGAIFNYTRDAFRIQLNSFTTDEIVSQRDNLEKSIEASLRERLELEGFVLEQLTSGLKYPASIVAAVNAKTEETQKAQKAEANLRTEKANAEVIVVQAKALAESNRIVSASITQNLINMEIAKKWNGVNSTTVLGNGTGLMVNVK